MKLALSFFPPNAEAETARPGGSIPETSAAVTPEMADSLVGEFAQRSLTEAEIDAHIKSLGELADRAYKDGDQHGARIWTDRMYAAIRGRSPAHQARMHEEAERRITEGVDFFQSADALALGRRYG